jgi:hypothetical protein
MIRRQLAIDYAEATAAAQIEVAAAREEEAQDPLGPVGPSSRWRKMFQTQSIVLLPWVIDAYTPDFECGYCQLELYKAVTSTAM